LFRLRTNAATLAISHHAGNSCAPSKIGRVFRRWRCLISTDASRYGKIKPFPHPQEKLREVVDFRQEWLVGKCLIVLFHNTRLGVSYPDETVRDAWGPILVQSLPG
jgi:hypothetical protein